VGNSFQSLGSAATIEVNAFTVVLKLGDEGSKEFERFTNECFTTEE